MLSFTQRAHSCKCKAPAPLESSPRSPQRSALCTPSPPGRLCRCSRGANSSQAQDQSMGVKNLCCCWDLDAEMEEDGLRVDQTERAAADAEDMTPLVGIELADKTECERAERRALSKPEHVGEPQVAWLPEIKQAPDESGSPFSPLTPMLVMPLGTFLQQGELPRSTSAMRAVALQHGALRTYDSAAHTAVFVSHKWWGRPKPPESPGAPGSLLSTLSAPTDVGYGSAAWSAPDYREGERANLKWRVLAAALESLVQTCGLDAESVVVWLDWFSIFQDDARVRRDGIRSLCAYVTRCKYMLIPTEEIAITGAAAKHPENLPGYGKRAWCRCEYFIFALWSEMQQPQGQPLQLYASSVSGDLVQYASPRVLHTAATPSTGELTFEADRAMINQHECAILRAHGEAAVRQVCMQAGESGTPAVVSNQLLDAASVPAIIDALRSFGVTAADMSTNRLGNDGAKAIAAVLVGPEQGVSPKGSGGGGGGGGLPALTSLDLRHNGISGEAAETLATAVVRSGVREFGGVPLGEIRARKLKKALLERMGLGPAEAIAVAQALELYRGVRHLDLSFNRVGTEGAVAIGRALAAPRSSLIRLTIHVNNLGTAGVKAIAEGLRNSKTLAFLELSGSPYEAIGIGDEGTIPLAVALEVNSSLKVIDLRANYIGVAAAKSLASALKVNTMLDTINLRSNMLGPAGATALGAALEVNGTVSFVNLALNQLGPDGGMAMAGALQVYSAITRLDLTSNAIGQRAGAAIGKAICSNKTLSWLSMEDNALRAEGALAFTEAVAVNETLRQLDMRDNEIRGDAARRLAEAVVQSTTLKGFGCLPVAKLRADKLTEIELNRRKVGVAEGIALARLLRKAPSVTKVSVCGDAYDLNAGIGPDGGREMLETLKCSTSITYLNLTANSIDEPTRVALRAAAAERKVQLAL